jgi:hypothetical protein
MQTTIDTAAQLLAAVTRQNELLTQILDALKQPALGTLTTLPGTMRVYCNRDRCPGALWYTVPSGEPVALDAKAIRGYLRQLRFEQVERRGKPTWKLYTLLDCGQSAYELESGHDSVFTKGLLMAIASMQPDDLQHAIAIGVAPGDDESVLLCRVWKSDNTPIFSKWNEQTNWKTVAQQAIEIVNAART